MIEHLNLMIAQSQQEIMTLHGKIEMLHSDNKILREGQRNNMNAQRCT
jgi:hypothetical protein